MIGEPGSQTRTILTCSRTHRGIRDRNEDACGVFSITCQGDLLLLMAVADGLGGHPAGEVASALAIEALRDAVCSVVSSLDTIDRSVFRQLLRTGFSHANREVIRHAAADPACLGMGTTMVAVLMDQEGEGIAGNIGDSRAYLVGEGITRITRDHSRVQEMMDQGLISPESAAFHPLRHIVTRILGRPEDTPDFFPFSLGDDRLILCSDGLIDGISEDELHAIVSISELSGLCVRLVEQARGRSRDNITVVAAGRG